MPDKDTNSLLDQLKDDSLLDNVDDIIDGLKTGDQQDDEETETKLEALTEEQLSEFIMQHGGQLIKESTAAVARLRKVVTASGDPEEVSAFADLVASTGTAIETLNKILVQNKKIKAAQEMKDKEIEAKKEVAKIKSGGDRPAGLLVASREEIFAMLQSGKPTNDVLDIETETITQDSEKMLEDDA